MNQAQGPKLKIKTDNKSLGDKCHLRRLLINETGLEPLRVLDLFAGEGRIWNELRRSPREVDVDHPAAIRVEKYTPVDAAVRQHGQIKFKITPRLIAALNGDATEQIFMGNGLERFNCIDVDSYGEPWAIWQAILFRIKMPTLVFLTRGRVAFGAGRVNLSTVAKESMGIPADWDIPVTTDVLEHADRCSLLQDCPTAKITMGYQIRLPRKGSKMDYFAVLVEPKNAVKREIRL